MSSQAAQPVEALRTLGDNAPHARRNHFLGVTAGMFAGVARDFIHPELILGGLIYALTRSPILVALIPAINKAGAMAIQLLASVWLEHRPRRRPYFILITFLRVGAFAALVGAMVLLATDVNALHLTLFYLAWLVCSLSGGAGHVIFMDMVGRLIAPHRVGSFLGMRQFLGGGVSIITGLLVVQPILSGVHLPVNYVVLAIIGTILIAVDMSTWCGCREEPGVSARNRTTLRESLARGMHWMRHDHNYRCYFWSRISFRICYLGLVFFIPFGSERLALEESAGGLAVLGGILVATFKLAGVVGSALWGKVADLRGSRGTMIWGGVFLVLSPLGALLAVTLPEGFASPIPGVRQHLTLPLSVYLLSLALLNLGIRAIIIGGQRFLITQAPPQRRASYLAFLNTITSPLTLLPLAAAILENWVGMEILFIAVAGGGLLAMVSAARMRETPSAAGAARQSTRND